MNYERNYMALVDRVITAGDRRNTRAGGTSSIFGAAIRIDELSRGRFPMLTTRHMYAAPVLGELAAFLRGAEDLATFHEFGCHYWDANAKAWEKNKGVLLENMRVGKVYGAKWRNFGRVDQLRNLVEGLKFSPNGRRHILACWDPAETDHCLPPCHILAQFYVSDGELSCSVYMRSVDLCLGLPSDVVLYAALLLLVAKECDYKPHSVVFFLGDCHVYTNHEDTWGQQKANQLREPPYYSLDEDASLFGFDPWQLSFHSYGPCPKVKYEFNV